MTTKKAIGGALIAIVVKFASDILASLAVGGLFLLGVPEWICIAVMGVLYLVTTLILVKLIYNKAFKLSKEEIGMKKSAPKPAYIILAAALPALVCGILLLTKGEFVMSAPDTQARLAAIAGITYNVIGAPVVEEVLFRGVIMNLLKKRWNTVVAVVLPSVLFGAVHIMGLEEPNPADCVQVVIAGTLVGIMFSLIALRTGSVWNGALVHAVWNLVMCGGILAIGAQPSEGSLVTFVMQSKSFLLTGGAFGAEASVIAIAAYLMVIIALAMSGKAVRTRLQHS